MRHSFQRLFQSRLSVRMFPRRYESGEVRAEGRYDEVIRQG